MNLVESYVLEVYGTEYYQNPDTGAEMWIVSVERNCYGRISPGTVYCFSKEEAEKVVPGYVYMS